MGLTECMPSAHSLTRARSQKVETSATAAAHTLPGAARLNQESGELMGVVPLLLLFLLLLQYWSLNSVSCTY
jgi:hypothetical protein